MLKWMVDGETKKSLISIAVGEKSIAFPRRSVKAGVDRTRVLRTGSGRSSIPSQSAGIHDIQLRVDLPPISNGHGPFFRQLPCRQIERLGQSHSVGKDHATTVQAAEPAVQALDGVGGIHDLPRGLGELEHRTDAVPIIAPAGHTAGEFGLPGGSNLVQASQRGLLVRRVIDRLQVVGERLFVLIRHVFERTVA